MPAFLRKWAKYLTKRTSAKRILAQPRFPTLCIGASTVTLGLLAQDGAARNTARSEKQAKKRLGDDGLRPSLTQSLTLSLITKRLDKLKSSDKVRLILDDRFFHFVDVEAPEQIPAHEIDSIFSWTLKEKGFAPVEDWLWDILSTPTTDQPHYQLALLERQQAELYLERLQLNHSQVSSIQPARAITPINPAPLLPPGPWLKREHVDTVLSSFAQRSMSVNLLANVVARARHQFQLGLSELTLALLLGASLVYLWWPKNPPTYALPTQTSLPSAAAPHPLLAHAALWDALRQPEQTQVQLSQVEFRRGRWYVSIRASDISSGQMWVESLTEALSTPWHVNPLTISSSGQSSLFELEISR